MAERTLTFKQILAGEDALNKMEEEITRSCNLVFWFLQSWACEEGRGKKWKYERFAGNSECPFYWSLDFITPNQGDGTGFLSSIIFYYDGEVFGEWGHDKRKFGLKGDRLYGLPRVHEGLQVLFDGLWKNFPSTHSMANVIASMASRV